MVDTIFADVAQPDQARIVAINAHNFLRNGGHFVISIKVLVLNFGLNHINIQKRSPLIRLLDLYHSRPGHVKFLAANRHHLRIGRIVTFCVSLY